jgi:5,6-dimethylbenzimidazole synthase
VKGERRVARMDISELLKLMRERRSYRAFKPDEVPEEAIRNILEAGRWAPSSANSQPWEFVIVRERETKEKIQENIRKVIKKIRSLRDFPFLKTFTADYVFQAPVQIVVCCDTRFMRVSMMNGVDDQIEQFAFWGSVSMAIQNMLLAAEAQGLGSVVFTDIYPDEIKRVLGVPEPLRVICILPVGYPAEKRDIGFRREIDEFTHREYFVLSKLRSDRFVEEARKDPYTVLVKRAK